MKIQVTDWEKTFANDFADKGPISTLDKEFSKLIVHEIRENPTKRAKDRDGKLRENINSK